MYSKFLQAARSTWSILCAYSLEVQVMLQNVSRVFNNIMYANYNKKMFGNTVYSSTKVQPLLSHSLALSLICLNFPKLLKFSLFFYLFFFLVS